MSWKLKEFERSMYKIIEVIDEDGNVIKTFVANELTYDEKKKKAQLMAAAPKLLEAAEIIVYENADIQINGLTILENAIKKAKGADK